MKSQGLQICFVVCLTVVTLVAGCSSTPQGRQRSAATIDSLVKVKAEIGNVITQVDATGASLQKLASSQKGDMAAAYKDYRKQLKALDSAARQVASRNQSLKALGGKYFAAWEKESAKIKSDQIRAISADRVAEAKASFDKMSAEFAKGKEAFVPMMDELRDIELYLSNDLTSAGIAACAPIAKQAVAHAGTVKDALRVVIADLGRIEAELTPTPTKK